MIESQQPAAATVPPVPTEGQGERRVAVRYHSTLKGCCQTLSVQRESSWQATVRNVSASGIGLILERRFERGVLLTVELNDRDGHPHLILARVRHATALPEGGWLIGCSLLDPLSEDEIRLLL